MRYFTLTKDIMSQDVVYDAKVWPREVTVPEGRDAATTEALLNLIFEFGQNDSQQRAAPSLSVDDLILLNGEVHRVEGNGFRLVRRVQLTAKERLAVDFCRADFDAYKRHMFEECERGMVMDRKLDGESIERFRKMAAQS